MPNKKLKQELTTKELAKRWDLSPGTLENWRSMERGPQYVKRPFGKVRVVYLMKDVIEYESRGQKVVAI
jgi:hypothetical protein